MNTIQKNVKEIKKISEEEYTGIVLGSNNKKYNVYLNLLHSRSSHCDCPHAKDRKVMCKHQVALYNRKLEEIMLA